MQTGSISPVTYSTNSVLKYTHGVVTLDVFFPDGKADCRHCDFCYYSEAFKLYRCRLTNAYIEGGELNERHESCPITITED